jgi:hypothetical protein
LRVRGLSPAYLPLEPHHARTDQVDAEITRVRASQFWQVLHPTVAVTARAPLRVDSAKLADAGEAPCSDGLLAARTPLRLDAGESALELTFSGPALGPGGWLASRPAAVDLQLRSDLVSGGDCVRLPLVNTATSAEWEYPSFGWSLGLGARLVVPTQAMGDLVGGWGGVLPIRLGHWLGPVRLSAELLVGRMGAADTSRDRHVNLLGIAAVAGVPLARGPRAALSLDAGYDLLDAQGGPRRVEDPAPHTLLHGPRAALRLDLLTPPNQLPGFRGQPPRGSLSFELFAAPGGSIAPGRGRSWSARAGRSDCSDRSGGQRSALATARRAPAAARRCRSRW